MSNILLPLRAFLDDVLAPTTLAVLDVSAFAEYKRPFVVRQQCDRSSVMLLDGGLVEAEVPQYAAKRAQQVLLRKHLRNGSGREHRTVDQYDVVAEFRD